MAGAACVVQTAGATRNGGLLKPWMPSPSRIGRPLKRPCEPQRMDHTLFALYTSNVSLWWRSRMTAVPRELARHFRSGSFTASVGRGLVDVEQHVCVRVVPLAHLPAA